MNDENDYKFCPCDFIRGRPAYLVAWSLSILPLLAYLVHIFFDMQKYNNDSYPCWVTENFSKEEYGETHPLMTIN